MRDRLHARLWGRLPLGLRWVLTTTAAVMIVALLWRAGQAVAAVVAVLLGVGGGAVASREAGRARREVRELHESVTAASAVERDARGAHAQRVRDIVSGPTDDSEADDRLEPIDWSYLDEPEVR